MTANAAVAASFQRDGDGFTSRCDPFVSCPPWVIAMIASDRIHLHAITLPAGYGNETLGQIRLITGEYDKDVFVSAQLAAELAGIGRQLLILDDVGDIGCPLTSLEKQSIEHLINLAG